MSDYEQIIQQRLTAARLSSQLSDAGFRLLNQYVRSIAMLDVPTPQSAVVRWLCNQLNLVEFWFLWQQSGRMATAMQQLPPKLYQQVVDIVKAAMLD